MRVMVLAALALGGCATTDAGMPAAGTADTIRYTAGQCFGTCPVYTVTVMPDGRGTFEGRQHTAVTGTRSFTLTRAQYDRFASLLAPHRPAMGSVRYQPGEANCGNAPTDMPSAQVTWTHAGDADRSIDFYFGCRVGNEAMATALEAAPRALPISGFIGPRG